MDLTIAMLATTVRDGCDAGDHWFAREYCDKRVFQQPAKPAMFHENDDDCCLHPSSFK